MRRELYYHDHANRRRQLGPALPPIVNICLIAVNIFVFVVFQGMGENEKFTYSFSTVPREIVTGHDEVTAAKEVDVPMSGQQITMPGLGHTPGSVYFTLITSMFMHGGLAHIFGNMLFLWIFGDNVEDALGHLRYFLFYIVTGIVASLAHVLTTVMMYGAGSEQALVPSLGASGAISGVLGGYILLFPQRRVTVVMIASLHRCHRMSRLAYGLSFRLSAGSAYSEADRREAAWRTWRTSAGLFVGWYSSSFLRLGCPEKL